MLTLQKRRSDSWQISTPLPRKRVRVQPYAGAVEKDSVSVASEHELGDVGAVEEDDTVDNVLGTSQWITFS